LTAVIAAPKWAFCAHPILHAGHEPAFLRPDAGPARPKWSDNHMLSKKIAPHTSKAIAL